MPLSRDLLASLEGLTAAATSAPVAWAAFPDDQDPVQYFADCVRRSPGATVHGVIQLEEGKDPAEEAVWVAITGNGRTSQANAVFYCLCHDMLPEVLAEVRRLYATYEPLEGQQP
jgi:hypothetical protein